MNISVAMKKANIIEVIDVTKRYGRLTAVDNLSVGVSQGICFGLLGPNGAGKTTLIEMIEGIIAPSSGEILFQGRPRNASFHEKIGIMFQQTALLAFMTVYETLSTFRTLYNRTMDLEHLIDLCSLDDIRNQFNDKISGGQRQRLLLALALVNEPELLFLDEPSTGLDPQARRNLWDIINTIKQQGRSIILTTHYMEEAQVLCDDIAIIDHGRLIARGTPQHLINEYTHGITISIPKHNFNSGRSVPELDLEFDENLARIYTHDINSVVAVLLKAGIDLNHMQVQTPDLETVFLNLTGRGLRD